MLDVQVYIGEIGKLEVLPTTPTRPARAGDYFPDANPPLKPATCMGSGAVAKTGAFG